ncbi:MAG: DUF3352 domain-containing protein [Acidimicrobiales bacterium]
MSAVLMAAGLLALPACGGKTDEKARAAGIVPADAVAFFSVNLDPSIEQKRNLLSVFRRFPGVKDEVRGDFENARDRLLDQVTEEGGLDYVKDVKPWLGNEIALAVLAGGGGEDGGPPPVVVLIQTRDRAKAEAALEKSRKAGDFEGQFRAVDDFMVIANESDDSAETADLEAVAAQAKKRDGGLAESKRFTTVVDELAGDRLLLAWADGKALGEEFAGVLALPGLDLVGDDAKSGPVAADLHAERSAVVVDGYAVATGETAGNQARLTRALPVETLGALTLFNLKGIAEEATKAIAGVGDSSDGEEFDPLAELNRETGIDLSTDVLAWMEGEVALVASEVPSGREFPDFGLVIEPTDRARAEAGLAKVVAALRDHDFALEERTIGGATAYVAPEPFVEDIQPAMALFKDRFVLANSPAYLGTLSKAVSPGFGSTKSYEAVLGEGSSSRTSFQLVVRIDPIREAIERALSGDERADYNRDARANVEPLNSFGISSRRDGNVHHFSMKLTFD